MRILTILKSRSFFLIAILLIYTSVAIYINKDIWVLSPTPYYNFLLKAFLDGNIFLTKTGLIYDLSLINDKLTMYWGPAPVIFIWPLSLVFGWRVSDVLYTLIAGGLNVILFSFILTLVNRSFKLKVSNFAEKAVVMFFAFGSPNFYLSMGGRIWHTNQIISITFLLGFWYLFFKFLQVRKIIWLVGAVFFFNLAWISRNSLFLYGLMFLYPLLAITKTAGKIKSVAIILFLIGVGFLFFAGYNYARFGNIWETGLSYQLADPRFADALRSKSFFSLKNFYPNFLSYFIQPAYLIPISPYIKFDPQGNSLFSVYPILIFLPLLVGIQAVKKKRFNILANLLLTIGGLLVISLLLFVGSGWTQFGGRYFLDVVPVFYLLSLLVVDRLPKLLTLIVLIYSFWINYLGALAFYNRF